MFGDGLENPAATEAQGTAHERDLQAFTHTLPIVGSAVHELESVADPLDR
jgi:hypothetical protein